MEDVEHIPDQMEREAVLRRRQAEVERKERIFNEKWRTIGVDKQALDIQMLEKKKQEDEENQNSRAYEALMLHNNRVAVIQNIREEEKQRAINKEIVNFRINYQQPYTRREYDLNDPDRLKKTKGDDARVSLCGLLGEDKERYDRIQRQREQFNAWLQQQRTEQALEKHKQKLEDEKHDQFLVDMDKKALLTQRRERQRKRETALLVNEHNLAKIEERRLRQLHFKEDHSVVDESKASMGVPGFCPNQDRRPQPESKYDIMLFHKHQMEEKKRKEYKKKQEDHQHSFLLIDSAQKALEREKEQEERNRLVRQNMDIINFKLAEIQMKAGLKRGQIYDEFFMQFNTRSR